MARIARLSAIARRKPEAQVVPGVSR
jgi:hypothetical protein